MKIPFVLLIDGMTGAGKTSVSKLLSTKLPRTAIIGLDKVKFFISDFERGDRDNGIARTIIREMTKIYLDNQISVVIEQPFKSEEVDMYESVAKLHSVSIYKVQLFTTPEVALNRVATRQNDWGIQVPEEHIKRNIAYFKSKEERGFKQIDTTLMSVDEVAAGIINLMGV